MKKQRQEARKEKKQKQVAFRQDTIKEESVSPVRSPSLKRVGEEEKAGSDYTSSDEDGKGVTIKGAA